MVTLTETDLYTVAKTRDGYVLGGCLPKGRVMPVSGIVNVYSFENYKDLIMAKHGFKCKHCGGLN